MGFLAAPGPRSRRYLYGYQVDEVDLTQGIVDELSPSPPTHGAVQMVMTGNPMLRSPEMVALPAAVTGAVFFRPDTGDGLSLGLGLVKRLIHERPKPDLRLLDELEAEALKYCEEKFTPLTAADIDDTLVWIDKANQPESVKSNYRRSLEDLKLGKVQPHKVHIKKTFTKAEWYDKPKFHRAIQSPSDHEKVLEGPIIAAMERQLYAQPEFIKKIARREWPAYISLVCEGIGLVPYSCDFASFEASFVKELMRRLELVFVRFMLQNVMAEEGAQSVAEGDRINYLRSRLVMAWVEGTRMSGKMSTSCFNGFSNLVVHRFVAMRLNGATVFRGVVEGDDGLFVHNGRQPTAEQFLSLGFKVKLENHEHFSEASFCGVVFARDVGTTVCDPMKVVLTCSWASRQYARASAETLRKLGVVKGLSTLAQYPGAPVVHAVALWLLRTNGFSRERESEYVKWFLAQRNTTWWDRELASQISEVDVQKLMKQPVEVANRLLVAKKFGMSPEVQLELERRFNDATGDVEVGDLFPEPYRVQWRRFVLGLECDGDLDLFQPPLGHHSLVYWDRSDYYALSKESRRLVALKSSH